MTKLLSLFCCGMLFAAGGCAQAKKPANQIEVWHWMTDRQAALDTLAKKYEQQTGIKVKLELFAPSDSYTQKIIAAAQANVLPDIYGILDKRSITATFIKAGYVVDISDDLAADGGAWQKLFLSKALDVNRFSAGNIDGVKPGVYGVPIDGTNVQMVYNRALLKKAGIERPPMTFDEFLTAVEALKRIGVAPFVSGFGELWLVRTFAWNYAFNIMGQDKVMATFRGEVPYTDSDWIKVLSVFKTLADKGAFIEGIVTKGNKYAEQDFALGRAAFAFNGSWGVNVYNDMNPQLDYGVMPPPSFTSAHPMSILATSSSFVVNAGSPNRDKAIAFLKWLTAKEQQVYLVQATRNLPANREALSAIPAILAEFAKATELGTSDKIWPVNEDPLVLEVFDKGIQAIMIGEKTPEAVAADVQKVKARQLEKMKK